MDLNNINFGIEPFFVWILNKTLKNKPPQKDVSFCYLRGNLHQGPTNAFDVHIRFQFEIADEIFE